jgi:hypothetical protein
MPQNGLEHGQIILLNGTKGEKEWSMKDLKNRAELYRKLVTKMEYFGCL